MDSFTWWIILCIGCMIFELSSPGLFFFLSFSLGALATALFSLYLNNPFAECIFFLSISALFFFLLKRFVKIISKDTLYKTNVYALRGKKGTVIERITPFQKGWVSIEGQVWSALSSDDQEIEAGAIVLIVNSSGSHVVVKKLETPF